MDQLSNSVKGILPQDLASECTKAATIIDAFIKPQENAVEAKVIPANILGSAKGIAVMSIVKAGLGVSGRAGSGLVIVRLPSGDWSAPSAIGTAGVGIGWQMGAEITDHVIILNTDDAVKAFTSGSSVNLGGNVSVAVGPYGRSAEGGGALTMQTVPAPVYSYSKSKGLFAGMSFEGSVIIERKEANKIFYGRDVTAAEILAGAIDRPVEAASLYQALQVHGSK
ncbi:SH3 domain-containing YSC84-like protein 1 [Globomyces pollinis-pini]|nr:SH3 domain-containing YSC84-like protein 1 [Globomyces pollinis-pini]